MTLKRLWHSFRLCLIRGSHARAEYLKRKRIFDEIGNNCSIMRRKVPLYAELIRIGDNVHIASNVSFITHDITHVMLNNIPSVKNRGGVRERMGCISIGNNVFIGAGSRILFDTKIGDNVIIGTGSIITKDIPSNSVVAGVPARVIGSFEEYATNMLESATENEFAFAKNQTKSGGFSTYMWETFEKKRC